MKSYREWDAAYVLGSLSPDERSEFEQHMETCQSCKEQVAELSGLPAILSALPQDQAIELLDPPQDTMPALINAAVRARRWERVRVAAAVVVAAALGAVLVYVSRPSDPVEAGGVTTQLTQTIPSPVTASVTLVEEPWGTRIDVKCDYAGASRDGPALPYTLYVSDASGSLTRVGSWSAGPGTSMTPTATTDVPRGRITRVEIRLATIDKTVLEARF
ncbi:anti-sigma factor family protein [Kibdelosporangium phytohabitans]|uniref:Putative zinc-finger domain-containing protein n=1 Tax=Kibdelosporangium phytohabitans TaxID=860235 RepID=A0A0N9I133_9PSEU|nr:zf-HC2 domain-containing protein [Kibdelosporangium phytohabitans]ALG08130.1 hypothetical protein AOZ06_15480 [Kibdelosporangium phytohabitans]MBE1470888.1 RNA polymerase sigma-70 factor (ECF subfamily) [Kibdelosporangium phytohabitans]